MANKTEIISTATAKDRADLTPGFSYNELMDELTKEIKLPKLDEEHEVTLAMIVKTTGRTESSVREFLERKVKLGELKKRHVIRAGDGQRIVAYYDPSKWNPEE